MMLYKNKKTGAVIKSDCKISGGGWEPVEPATTGSKDGDPKPSGTENASTKTIAPKSGAKAKK